MAKFRQGFMFIDSEIAIIFGFLYSRSCLFLTETVLRTYNVGDFTWGVWSKSFLLTITLDSTYSLFLATEMPTNSSSMSLPGGMLLALSVFMLILSTHLLWINCKISKVSTVYLVLYCVSYRMHKLWNRLSCLINPMMLIANYIYLRHIAGFVYVDKCRQVSYLDYIRHR